MTLMLTCLHGLQQHLQIKNEIDRLTIGTDDEQEIRKAIREILPDATNLFFQTSKT